MGPAFRAKHKVSKKGAANLLLVDALTKLKELEMQATENRFHVAEVRERVAVFLERFEKSRINSNGLDEEAQMQASCHLLQQSPHFLLLLRL